MFEKLEERLLEANKSRNELFFRSMSISEHFSRERRIFFAVATIIFFLLFVASFSLTLTQRNNLLSELCVATCTVTGLICFAQYLNLLEKDSNGFRKKCESLLEKNSLEIRVLENFKNGTLEIDEVRTMYRNQSVNPENEMRTKKQGWLNHWFIFISIATSITLLIFSLQ